MPRSHSLPVPDEQIVIERAQHGLFTTARAVYDPTRTYRYSLSRRWAPDGERVCFVMLNPSTATARSMDPTNRRCLRFAERWGFTSFECLNLFAYRATDPKVMQGVADPVGPLNDGFLSVGATAADLVVVAWGDRGVHEGRDEAVVELLGGVELWCLGLTKVRGCPRHPLYVKGDVPLRRFYG